MRKRWLVLLLAVLVLVLGAASKRAADPRPSRPEWSFTVSQVRPLGETAKFMGMGGLTQTLQAAKGRTLYEATIRIATTRPGPENERQPLYYRNWIVVMPWNSDELKAAHCAYYERLKIKDQGEVVGFRVKGEGTTMSYCLFIMEHGHVKSEGTLVFAAPKGKSFYFRFLDYPPVPCHVTER